MTSAMTSGIDTDFSESFLLPPHLEEWIPKEHPARFICEMVDAVDFEELGFRSPRNRKGRPFYTAKFMTRIWLYCWFERIRSFRDIERACYNDIGVIWLTGNRQPDHNTIWRFWRDNQIALRELFRKSAEVALRMNLVQMVLHAVDGTKIIAAASRKAAIHRPDLEKVLARVDQQIEQFSAQLNAQQAEQHESEYLLKQQLADAQTLRTGVQQALEQLDRAGVDRLQPKEPQARMMKTTARTEWGYNAQAVADHVSSIIVAQDVVQDESDNRQLVRMIDQVNENLGAVAECTVGDGGYEDGKELAEAERKGYGTVVRVHDPGKDSPYHVSHFEYDAGQDRWICPQGRPLVYHDQLYARDVLYTRYKSENCSNCPVKSKCTKQGCRTISVHENYEVLNKHREKLKEPEARRALYLRKQIIEPRFGWIKQRLGVRRFTVRGLTKVKTQWAVVCTTWNLRRMWKLLWGDQAHECHRAVFLRG